MASLPLENSKLVAAAQAQRSSPTTNSGASQPPQPAHLRTCVLCRQRKVKCDRRQPCSNCVRAGATCIHPPGAGRAAKKSRSNTVDTKVLDRLAQLEKTIKRLQHQTKGREASSSATPEYTPQAQQGESVAGDGNDGDEEVLPELGHLVVGQSQSRYVSHIMWTGLTESIEQLRGLFLNSDTQEEDPNSLDGNSPLIHDAEVPNLVGFAGPNAALLGFRSLAYSLRSLHPTVELSVRLFKLFIHNVLPVVYIFHAPTVTQLFWDAVMALDGINRETEALLFAIYYSTVISLDPTQCANVVGEPRSVVVERYKFGVEQALARANLLNTESILLLQAAVLYVTALRSDDGTRAVWSLIGLITHIARSMGLHRDGAAFNLPPFETEIRRRIWFVLSLLDYRSTEYHGYEPVAVEQTPFDTRWPLNVNDSQLSNTMTDLPQESDGPTEMIILHCRCHAFRLNQEVHRKSKSSFCARVKDMDEHDKWINEYTSKCDPTQPLHRLAIGICHVAAGRARANIYYEELRARKLRRGAPNPQTKDNSGRNADESSDDDLRLEVDSKVLRDQLFVNAIFILKRIDELLQDQDLEPWAWHSRTFVQWQTLSLALLEVCTRPPCSQCDAAWKYANSVYNKWLSAKNRNDSETGNRIVKPMNELLARAQQVRNMRRIQQQAESGPGLRLGPGPEPEPEPELELEPQHHPTHSQISKGRTGKRTIPGQQGLHYTSESQAPPEFEGMGAIHTNDYGLQPNMDPTTATIASSDMLGSAPPTYAVGGFGPFIDMLPDELQNEWFELMARGSVGPSDYSGETMDSNSFPKFP